VCMLNTVKLLSGRDRAKLGFTITELMIASLIISMAVALVHRGMTAHMRTLRVSALLMEAQDLAYSELWNRYGLPFSDLKNESFPTPVSSRLGDKGTVRILVLPDPADSEHVTLVCEVWSPPLGGYGAYYEVPRNLVGGKMVGSTYENGYQIECFDR